MSRELEIYIHIPFCVKKCDYCDFFSQAASSEEQNDYVEALLCEIKATEVSDEYRVVSIFFGGGTPSILPTDLIYKIMKAIKEQFEVASDAEITIECNPGTVGTEKLNKYRENGINRVSFGLQSIYNAELSSLGRIHTYEDFLASYEAARIAGFKNISVDLMSGLPGQTVKSWVQTLETVSNLEPKHISAYSLIIEDGTPFAIRELNLPDEDDEREMYEKTSEVLASHGYRQYEISNYAKEGYECRHNIGYWKRVDYLGFGAGASSLFNNVRYNNIKDLELYEESSSELSKIRCDIEFLDEKLGMEEFIFLGLRMTDGITDTEFKDEFGVSLRAVYGDEIDKLVEQGLLDFDEHDLKLTSRGISVSNHVFVELLA